MAGRGPAVSREADIWAPDDDPAIAAAEAAYTNAGMAALYGVHQDVHRALGLPQVPADVVREAYHAGTLPAVMAKADVTRGGAWNKAAQLFARLRGLKRVGAQQARDLAAAATHKWFAEGYVQDEPQRQALTAFLTGQIRARGRVPAGTPDTLEQASRMICTPDDLHRAAYVQARAAEHVQGLEDSARRAVALTVIDAELQGASPQQLAGQLLDKFADQARDWRRVAITEVAASRAAGFLAGIPAGEEVEWSAAEDACVHCRAYHGQRFRVTRDPGDHHTQVWAGKSNVGRSWSPRRRDGTQRGPDELAGPTIPAHPHCRCRYLRVLVPVQGGDRVEQYLKMLSELS